MNRIWEATYNMFTSLCRARGDSSNVVVVIVTVVKLEAMNEWMFNDTPAQNINRLLGVSQMVS